MATPWDRKPTVIDFFEWLGKDTFGDIFDHARQVRKIWDAPGSRYHDCNEPDDRRMNRWCVHNSAMLCRIHHDPKFITKASELFGQPVKPSYVFLSMYGPEGVVPLHSDRPQCQFTVDLQIASDGEWPIWVEDKPYVLQAGQALCYSGTSQPHYRKPMALDSVNSRGKGPMTFMNLAFFHFVPTNWVGGLD